MKLNIDKQWTEWWSCLNYHNITSLPFEILDLDDFFPNSTVLIHFPGDLPILGPVKEGKTDLSVDLHDCCFRLVNLKACNYSEIKHDACLAA